MHDEMYRSGKYEPDRLFPFAPPDVLARHGQKKTINPVEISVDDFKELTGLNEIEGLTEAQAQEDLDRAIETMWLHANSDLFMTNDEDDFTCSIDLIGGTPRYCVRAGIVENGSVECDSTKHQIREVSAEVWRDCLRLQQAAELRRLRQAVGSALFEEHEALLSVLRQIADRD
jgi:hypothetical protein